MVRNRWDGKAETLLLRGTTAPDMAMKPLYSTMRSFCVAGRNPGGVRACEIVAAATRAREVSPTIFLCFSKCYSK
jgi:hypothetical protein